ncbi:epidermal growth factor receptor isoform X2 [Atheta coriaria]|uniref:epidermal growth factor receptor isoform X2 n=1 Tax=Dalotia coriaria TaxID=877792 RepID=UPI0031F4130B
MPSPTGAFVYVVLLLWMVDHCIGTEVKTAPKHVSKLCIGTNGRMSVPSNRDHHYRNMKERFTNCTYVDGNLELTWLQDEDLDLSFLQYIREVTGYVLISHVDIRKIVLPRLQIIRGRTLFKLHVHDKEFSLLVTLSKMFTLELPALRDVLSGSIGLFNNYNLCHIKTINWDEIISDPAGSYVYVYNFTSPERECSPCHSDCSVGCWGDGPENCQKFSKEYCSPQCYQGRCFGSEPRQCCHLFCAGGCTGPKQSDCLACKNFYDEGVCTQECPPMQIYNPTTYSWEPNPNGKYAYGATCVKKCPEHLLKDSGACVRTCPPNKKATNGECVPCDGPCPKTCPIVGDGTIHALNIESFRGCTVIDGSIQILDNSFYGYQHIFANYTFGDRIPAMHPDQLEVFSTLKEVTGFINIQGNHSAFKNLSYFRNLEIIGGRHLHEYFSSLFIVKTSLESLELKSLRSINSGTVIILENMNLCYAVNINWKKIVRLNDHVSMIKNNKQDESCSREGLVCDKECSSDGCWGPGPTQCLACKNFKYGSTCIQNCHSLPGIYKDENNICKKCHEQCGFSCTGPGADNCTTCKHYKDGPYCVSSCPATKYADGGVCRPCHKNCVDGCTGPSNALGTGGCKSCDRAIMNGTTVCLQRDESCPDGYYYETVQRSQQNSMKVATICRKCHPRCKKCSGYGFHELVCQECTNYKRGEQCEDDCPQDHYADDETHMCVECDKECRGCTGPGPDHCVACQTLKIYPDGQPSNTSSFTCADKCPPNFPSRSFLPDQLTHYCSAEETALRSALAVNRLPWFMVVAGFIIILASCVAIGYGCYCYKKNKVKEETMKITMAMTGIEDDCSKPSNVRPNLARLRIIKEAEIRRAGILGYGAFGTVYKGVWVPEEESNKIPVAIKVLRENTGANSSKELLDEAYIMATVEHPNLLKLLAVCMTSQMMLITQLMPLGCLLDFVRKHREKVGSKLLLSYCTQIARGMAYLEDKRLVHRDLAARNVLVQAPTVVKITDFGLAKLLDINEEEYKAAGGKMPIKWLALECIQHRIFTHKSDVWAFGVTVWELLTFGDKPYDSVPARDVPDLLENGERLPQPAICSIDVYMIMIKCWMLDAESRPCFRELEDDFSRMARDPPRYLAIDGDVYLGRGHVAHQDQPDSISKTLSSISNNGTLDYHENQPKSRAPFQALSFSPPPTPVKWPNGSQTSDGSCAPQNQHNWNQERLRFAQAMSVASTIKRDTSDDSSILYSGDGLGSYEYDSASRAQAQVGNVKVDLPVDEDDYLVPSPQQAQLPYVELKPDLKGDSTSGASGGVYFSTTNIDNPEYIFSNDTPLDTRPCQTLGIPTLSEFVDSNPEVTNPTRGSEEESDHEYYNDFDRLTRELQPLQRKGGETTV